MSRLIRRDYLATPELLKDGATLPPVPTTPDDWIGLQRLLIDLRKNVTGSGGTITGRTFRTAVEPDKRVQITTADGIQIFDENNNLVAQLDGDSLTILGGTITGATFQTAASPAQRVEITTANGIRIYDGTNTLTAQFNGADILLNNVFSLADTTTFITLGAGGVSFADGSSYRGTFSSNGLLITSPRIAFNTYTSADVAISSSGTTILIGKADGSGFADLEARNLIATTHLTAEGVTSTGATGIGNLVFGTSPTFVTPVLGTPTSGTLTNCTIPVGGVTGLGTGVATFLATPSSANLASAVTGETGSGALVFATSPSLTTPDIGAATGSSLSLSSTMSATGIAVLNGAADSGFELRASAGQSRYVFSTTGGTNRFLLRIANADAEAGANAGSNFDLIAFTDGGGIIDTPLKIVRAAGGHIQLNRSVDISGTLGYTFGGFNGSGSYTNFVITDGIIYNAS